MRVAVAGKGGSGKSLVAGTMARILARSGVHVLALDSDLMPGLAFSLGTESRAGGSLAAAAERNEEGRWRLRKGIGPVKAVRRYATVAPDGVRLLEGGKLTPEGLPPIMGSLNAFYQVVHRLPRSPAFASWALIGDLPAGPRQVAFDWAPYADAFLVVVEPTRASALTARRVARIARSRRGAAAQIVANKVTATEDLERLEELLGERLLAAIPADEAVARTDRRGDALIDHAPRSPAVLAIERLVGQLTAG